MTEPKKNSTIGRTRKFALLGGGAIAAVAVFLIALPTILSTGPGTSLVARKASASIPGQLSFDDLDLSWSGGQQISGLTLNDPAGKIVAQIEMIELPEAGLLSLASGDTDLGTITITRPRLDLYQDAEGRLNLTEAIGAASDEVDSTESEATLPVGTRLDIQLIDPEVSYEAPGVDRVELDIDAASAQLQVPGELTTNFATAVRQNEREGRLAARVDVQELFGEDGRVRLDAAQIDAELDINGFPTIIADRLGQAGGQLVALIGPLLEARIVAKVDAASGAGPVEVTLTGDLFQTRLTGQLTRAGIILDPGSRISADLNADALASVNKMAGEVLPLLQRVEVDHVDVVFDRFSASRDMDLTQLEAKVRIESPQVRLVDDALDATMRLQDFHVDLATTERAGVFQTRTTSRISSRVKAHPTVPGRLESTATISGLADPAGQLTTASMSISTATSFSGVPVQLVDDFLEMEGQVVGIVGTSASAEVQARIPPSGPTEVDLVLTSPAAKMTLPVSIGDEIILTADAVAEIPMTRNLSRALMSKILPIVEADSSQQPIRLVINKDGFRAPPDFALDRVSMNASLDVGQITLVEESKIVGLLRSIPGFKLPKKLGATFTPMTMAMKDGRLSYTDLLMSVDRLQMKYGGTVDVAKDKIDLLMQIPAESLTAAVGELKGLLAEGESFDVPIGGTMGAPTLDSKAFSERLTKLAAKAGLRYGLQRLVGDQAGEGLGGVLAGALGGEKDASTESSGATNEAVEKAVGGLFDKFKKKKKKD